jgi:hypothetical protein
MWFSINGVNLFLLDTESSGGSRQFIAKNMDELSRTFPDAQNLSQDEILGIYRAEVTEIDLAKVIALEIACRTRTPEPA